MTTKAIAPSNYFFDSLAKAFARNLYKNETVDKKNLNSLGFVRRNLIKATRTPGTCLGWSSLAVSALSSAFLLPSLIRDYGSNSLWENVKKAFIPVLSLLGTIGSFILNSSGTNRVEETIVNESNKNVEIANKIIQNIKAKKDDLKDILIFNDDLSDSELDAEMNLLDGYSYGFILKTAGLKIFQDEKKLENYLMTSSDPKHNICVKQTVNGEERYYGLMFECRESGGKVKELRTSRNSKIFLYSVSKNDHSFEQEEYPSLRCELPILFQSIESILANGVNKNAQPVIEVNTDDLDKMKETA